MENAKIDRDIAVLTEEQTTQVAGGLMSVRGGCPTCTSGLQLLFKNEVEQLAK